MFCFHRREKKSFLSLLLTFSAPDRLLLLSVFSLTACVRKKIFSFLNFIFAKKIGSFCRPFVLFVLTTFKQNEFNKTQSHTFSVSFQYDYVLFSQTREKKSFLSLLLTFSAPDRLLLLSVSSLTACVREKNMIWDFPNFVFFFIQTFFKLTELTKFSLSLNYREDIKDQFYQVISLKLTHSLF